MKDVPKDAINKSRERKPKGKAVPFETLLLILFAISTSLMVLMASFGLFAEDSALTYLKAFLMAASAGLVSYAINRFAIEKGAELAATGFKLAGAVSVISMLAVGGGLFASTYAGLTIASVNELRLQEHGQALSAHVNVRNDMAAQATRAIPVVNTSAADFREHLACEAERSCLSGRGNGGRGRVTRKLEEIAVRADNIAAQLKDGEATRQGVLNRLNELVGAYHSALSDTKKSLSERRSALHRINARINQSLSDLDEAVPVAMLIAYAQELNSGTSISARPEATKNLNALLRKHGHSLDTVLSSREEKDITPPSFPALAGVSSTFEYIGRFIPIAALTACIELILPLSFWFFTFLTISWEKHLREQEAFELALIPQSSDELEEPSKLNGRRPRGRPRMRPAAE